MKRLNNAIKLIAYESGDTRFLVPAVQKVLDPAVR